MKKKNIEVAIKSILGHTESVGDGLSQPQKSEQKITKSKLIEQEITKYVTKTYVQKTTIRWMGKPLQVAACELRQYVGFMPIFLKKSNI